MSARTSRAGVLTVALTVALATGWVGTDRALAAAPPAASPASPSHPAAGLASTRTLVAKLASAGRGEVPVTVSRSDPMGGPDHEDHGRLMLEPPDRVRLEFSATGEKIALRGDGGEWVQPAAKQMVRIRREQAGLAAWLWEVFLAGGGGAFSEQASGEQASGEQSSGERRYTLEPRDREAGLPARITITLDAHGLPAEVRFVESEGVEIRYRFQSWSFRAAKGARAFALTAPHGYAVVDLP